jgi:WD40 repeat protein
MIAAVGKGRAITLWDAATGKEIHRFPNLFEFLDSVAFSPDGKILATGGSVCRLWDVATGKEVRQLLGGRVAFSPDDKLVVTTGTAGARSDNMLRLWDASSGKEQWHIDCGVDSACGLAYSPDGKLVASGTSGSGYRDNSVHVWEAVTGRLIRRFEGQHSCVTSVAFSPDGLIVASGAGDSTILLWDITGHGRDDVRCKELIPIHRRSEFKPSIRTKDSGFIPQFGIASQQFL